MSMLVPFVTVNYTSNVFERLEKLFYLYTKMIADQKKLPSKKAGVA